MLQAKTRTQQVLGKRNKQAPGPNFRESVRLRNQYKASFLLHAPTALHENYGGIISLPDLTMTHLISDAQALAILLKEKQENYLKTKRTYILQPVFGQSIFTSEGDYWQQCRKTVQPAYVSSGLAQFYDKLHDNTELLCHHWLKYSNSKSLIDAELELTYIAALNSARAQLNYDLSPQVKTLVHNVLYLQRNVNSFTKRIPSNYASWRCRYAFRQINKITQEILRQNKNSPTATGISQLLQKSQALNDTYGHELAVFNNVKTLLISGYETVSHTLTWACYLLATHPEVQQQLQQELQTSLNGHYPNMQQLNQLEYLEAVVNETLRLYPSVWSSPRVAQADDEVLGYVIPQNSLVFFHFYGLHRNPEYWSEPNTFKPERFLNQKPVKDSFIPFSTGKHQCIASQFARMEIKLTLCRIMQQMRLQCANSKACEPLPLITLFPSRKIWLKATRRA